MGLLDIRSRKLARCLTAHDKKTNSIEAHPTVQHLVVSASTDRTVSESI
jgi:hypothetical protein